MALRHLLLIVPAILLPFNAYAQAPDVTAQANAVAIQGTRMFTMMAAQIEADQAKIADLQKQLAAVKPAETPSK